MTTHIDDGTSDPLGAAEAQAPPTQSVAEPMPQESHDAELPLWKRWLKRGRRS